ncbi:MAG: sulfate permease [Candidatus Microthrix sp.]|uniref:Sulfate permease n=1 Tax=Candidatus Neomicrothrix subdominans TaxID=2954438 RepID=A0A936TC15_9ACTN|nr:sulfate permease [Candidatus Microthrix sp.]MBK7166353.1 sulfate permease [Candidatus Microthrix sp.]MBK9295991.1 sulfate permease [Candidatus Microthrix subdominans]
MPPVKRLLPIFEWLPRYQRSDLRYDVIAGVTVSALVVPKALGYAGIALIPIQNGLYAAAAGALIYAIFGTSRQISTGPSSAIAAVAASAVVTTGLPADEAPQLVAAVTLMAGVLFLALSVLKMGWISRFLSKAVITGFLFGAAIEVVVGELPKTTGTEASGENSWREFASWWNSLDSFHGTTLLVGAVALGAILAMRFIWPRVPGALVLVVGGLVAAQVFNLADRGVATVGEVPRGVPAPAFPGLSVFTENFPTITVAAIALLLIGFSQTAGDARMFASRHKYRIDVDQESLAQGMSNVGSGLFQGMPVSTSLSASSLSDSTGARTQMSSVVTGAMVILTLLVFAPLFSDLPKPVLAAIIIDAVVFGMMDVAEMRRLWRVARVDFWIAIGAILGVLTSGVLAGVIIGIVLSLGWLVYVNARPPTPELGRRPGTTTFRPLEQYPDDETYPGVLVLGFDGGLYFATTEVLTDRLRDKVVDADPPIEDVILDFEAVNFIDSQGVGELDRLAGVDGDLGITVHFARMKDDVRAVLAADGVVDRLGPDHFHVTVDGAMKAVLAARQTR